MVSSMDSETLHSGWVGKTECPWVHGNEGGNHLERGKGFIYLFFYDFYQNTEIQHTHKPARKRRALFTALAGTCPPGQPPARGVGRGSATSAARGNETGENRRENG